MMRQMPVADWFEWFVQHVLSMIEESVRKGDSSLIDAGYIYAPYIPLQATPTFTVDHSATMRKFRHQTSAKMFSTGTVSSNVSQTRSVSRTVILWCTRKNVLDRLRELVAEKPELFPSELVVGGVLEQEATLDAALLVLVGNGLIEQEENLIRLLPLLDAMAAASADAPSPEEPTI